MMMRNLVVCCLFGLLVSGLVGCGEALKPAAPIGDLAVLEQLAEAYRQTSEQVPVQPRGLRPEARKQFVQQVFAAAGYDYGATLAALAQGVDAANQQHRDLAELLLLPVSGLADEAAAGLYSASEWQAVRHIRQVLR